MNVTLGKLGGTAMVKVCMTFMLMSVLLLSGCGLRVALRGQLDPAYAPKKSEPLAVVLPDNSSIEDRQAFSAIKMELEKTGFQVVELDKAAWVLGVGTHEDTYFSGIKNSGFGIATVPVPGVAVGSSFGSSKAEYTSRLTIYCWLYPAMSFRSGKRVAIWEGIEKTTPQDFYEYPDKLVGALLEIYGKNFYDDSERVSRVKHDVSQLNRQ